MSSINSLAGLSCGFDGKAGSVEILYSEQGEIGLVCKKALPPPPPPCTDVDGDGSCSGEDCNDTDPAVHPGAFEVCGNQIDDDCDAQVNEGCPGLYPSHTIVIDGQNDFDPRTEAFVTSSPEYTSYVAWDADYLYAALKGPDVASQDSSKWLLLYLGTGSSSGTTAGYTYRGQRPTLSFRAQYHVRWNAGSMPPQALTFEDSWAPNGWDLGGQAAQSGDFVEMRIPRAALRSPSTVRFHMSMVDEAPSTERSYAATPSASFVDGFDPDFSHHYAFALESGVPPNVHSSQP